VVDPQLLVQSDQVAAAIQLEIEKPARSRDCHPFRTNVVGWPPRLHGEVKTIGFQWYLCEFYSIIE
jgi:hypothetical protein